MKKIITILIGAILTMSLSSCFGPEFWDDCFFGPGMGPDVIVVHDHPGHGGGPGGPGHHSRY